MVRYIAGGVYVPVEGYEIEPEQGKDIVTTIDVNIQDITENALLRMMEENECANGTAIVMEVKTGKIKAMANLDRREDGTYWEDLNYAIRASVSAADLPALHNQNSSTATKWHSMFLI